MNSEIKEILGFEPNEGEEITEDTINEFLNGKGEDENE